MDDWLVEDYPELRIIPEKVYKEGASCPLPKEKVVKPEKPRSYLRGRKITPTVRKLQHRLYQKTGEFPNAVWAKNELGIDFFEIEEELGECPGEGYHIDHIVPLACFDLSKRRHIQIAMHPWNHRWLKGAYNVKRDSKMTGRVWAELSDSIIKRCLIGQSFRFNYLLLDGLLSFYFGNLDAPQIVMVL